MRFFEEKPEYPAKNTPVQPCDHKPSHVSTPGARTQAAVVRDMRFKHVLKENLVFLYVLTSERRF